jgi:hypothetical protein
MASDNPCGLQNWRAAEADAELARSFCGVYACGSFSTILDRLCRFFELAAQSHQARRCLSGSAETKHRSPKHALQFAKIPAQNQRSAASASCV